jgi:copper transport protein
MLSLALLALLPAVASAHAVLQETTPARGAALDAAPREVVLRFSEPVEAAFGAVRVYDAAGERADAGEVRSDGKTVAVGLRRGLPEGGFTVTYRVVSSDSHPISGGFVFAVGEGAAPGRTVDELLQGSGAGPMTGVGLGLARGVQYAATALAIGTVVFLLACWLPALRAAGLPGAAAAAFAARTRRLLMLAALAGIASGVALLALQAANAGGVSVWSALDRESLQEVLRTRFGVMVGIGVLAWFAVLGIAGLRRSPAPGALAAPLLAVALVPAVSGHAAADAPLGVLITIHVVAISAWIGGVAVLVLGLRAATRQVEGEERMRLLGATVARFSVLAGAAVAVVLGTGIAQSLFAIDDPAQLVDTAYGRAVALKLALFALLVGLGSHQRRRVLPGLRAGGAAAGTLLRRVLRAELAVGVAVLGVTAALAGYPPSDSVAAGPFSGSAALGPARAEVTVDPARAGANELHLYLFERTSGAQWDVPKEVALQIALPERDVAPIELEARKAGPGHYVASAAAFGLPGDWDLSIAALITEFDELRAHLTIPIEE